MYFIILVINIYLCLPCDSSIIRPDTNQELIIGGREAKKGQFPFAAALYYNGRFICTASILSEWTAMTAAHCCVFNGEAAPAHLFHMIPTNDRNAKELRMNISKIIPNPNYSMRSIVNDIAILKMDSKIPLGGDIDRICVAGPSDSPGKKGIVLGWGQRGNFFFTNPPGKLHYVDQRIITNEECREYFSQVEDTKICAEGFGYSGLCSGDSGGPLISSEGGVTRQVGITSYGFFLCGIVPDVFTRLSEFNPFIKEAAEDDAICFHT